METIDDIRKWLNEARNVSLNSTNCCNKKVGMIVVRDNSIKASAFNGDSSCKKDCNCDNNECKHIIEKIVTNCNDINELDDGTLYTTLKPCAKCLTSILECGITKLYYAEDSEYKSEGYDYSTLVQLFDVFCQIAI